MKHLLLTTVGKNDAWYKHWFEGGRNFDVGLVCYEPTLEGVKVKSEFFFWHLPDFKYPALYQIIYNNPWILETYDYVFMPDDDVLMTTDQINQLFDWSAHAFVHLGQPSIAAKNYTWPITLQQKDCSHRWVKMVEIMCPIFSNFALNRCWKTFNESSSGWGLDAVWAKILNYNKIAVCDTVCASHEKALDEGGGRLYEKLRKEKGITDPRQEMQALLKSYNAVLDFTEYAKVKRQ